MRIQRICQGHKYHSATTSPCSVDISHDELDNTLELKPVKILFHPDCICWIDKSNMAKSWVNLVFQSVGMGYLMSGKL